VIVSCAISGKRGIRKIHANYLLHHFIVKGKDFEQTFPLYILIKKNFFDSIGSYCLIILSQLITNFIKLYDHHVNLMNSRLLRLLYFLSSDWLQDPIGLDQRFS
jgi:hypothetical protein